MAWRASLSFLLVACFSDIEPGQSDDGGSTEGGSDSGGTTMSVTVTSSPSTSTGTSTMSSDATTTDPATSDPATSEPTSTSSTDDTGEPPPNCGEMFDCLPPPPEGWIGPLLVTQVDGDDAPPQCPPMVFPELMLQSIGDPGPAECECTCGEPHDVECFDGASVSANLGGTCGDTDTFLTVGPGCIDGGNAYAVVAFAGTPTSGMGGACDPESSESVAPIEIAETLRVCGIAEPDSCDAGVCAPHVPGIGDYRRCLVHDGDVECPTGFGARRLAVEDFADTRGCGACTCDDPDTACTPYLDLFSSDGCAGLVNTLEDGQCVEEASIESYLLGNVIGGGCSEISAGPVGTVTRIGQHTVCCEP